MSKKTKTTDRKNKCSSCKHWLALNDEYGQCRGDVPQVFVTKENELKSTFPIAKHDEFCGRFSK